MSEPGRPGEQQSGPRCAQPVPRRRQLAQLPNGRGRHAPVGGVLSDPIAEARRAVLDVVQVKPAEYRPVLGDEHVESADAGLLLSAATR